MKFTQKWAVAGLLAPIEEGSKFPADAFPLHITLLGVFAIDYDGQTLAEMLADELRDQKAVPITVGPMVRLGPNGDVEAMSIKKTDEIVGLHKRLYRLISSAGAVFNDPQYQDDNYLPHSTNLKGHGLTEGGQFELASLSLIDLYPDNDGRLRKVAKNFELLAKAR